MSKHFKDPPPIEPSKPPIDDRAPIPIDDDGKPDLQMLIRRWNGYDNIPKEIWEKYESAMARWHLRRRDQFTR